MELALALLMFEKEIILGDQLAPRCLFQCSPARKLPANIARWIVEGLPVNQNLCALQESSR